MSLKFRNLFYPIKTTYKHYSSSEQFYAQQIKNSTIVCTNHLTPEIKLHLITEQCKLWHLPADQCQFVDPFWAFYWPGGQAISRFILDNCQYVTKKTVLDVGSGSAACSIASVLAGASHVTANDIDPVASIAAKLNAQLNNVNIDVLSSNILFEECPQWEVIIVGDVFYSKEIADVLWKWLDALRGRGKTILIGDPGRHCFKPEQKLQERLKKLKEYNLMENCCLENRGFSSASVWMLD